MSWLKNVFSSFSVRFSFFIEQNVDPWRSGPDLTDLTDCCLSGSGPSFNIPLSSVFSPPHTEIPPLTGDGSEQGFTQIFVLAAVTGIKIS